MREGFFFMIQQIVKRDGRMAPFEIDKITNAIFGAAQASGGQDHDMVRSWQSRSKKRWRRLLEPKLPPLNRCRTLLRRF